MPTLFNVRWLLVATASAAAPLAAQHPCSAAFADSVSTRTLATFERVASAPPVWDDYSLGRHPLLLLADSTYRGRPETPVCAAIWRKGAPLEPIELPARPPFSTPFYGMIDSDPAGPRANASSRRLTVVRRPAPAAVVEALKAKGVTRVIMLNVPMRLASLGPFGETLAAGGADPAIMQARLAVDESFHLHSQLPTWLDQPRTYEWPAWDVQPERTELQRRCYAGSPELTAALKEEQQALVAAFDAVAVDSSKRDPALGLQHAGRFIDLRAARRKLQDTITVAQTGARISCRLAEDVMELEEGTRQWLGSATTLRAGLTTTATLRGSFAASQPAAFYQLGPLQLWVLEGLVGREAMHGLTRSIARSAGPDGGVFGQFVEHVTRLSAGR